jgi:hypothetical protein
MGLVMIDEDHYWLGEPNQHGQPDREDRIHKAVEFIKKLV